MLKCLHKKGKLLAENKTWLSHISVALRHEEVKVMGREVPEVSWSRRPIAYRKLIYEK